MKLRYWFVLSLIFVLGSVSWSYDYILVPENFYMHKGDTLNVHLFSAEQFDKPKEVKYLQAETSQFALYTEGKKTDLKPAAKDGAMPVVNFKLNTGGLALVEMARTYPDEDIDKADFTSDLDNEGLVKLSEKVNNAGQNRISVKYTSYIKTMVTVDKPSGNIYSKIIGQQLEITLDKNPFKLSYGDDVTAYVNFRGKPLVNARVDLLVKTSTGRVYPDKYITDAKGAIYFKTSREGIYLLRLINVEPSASKTVDYEKWGAAFSFAFSNNGSMENTYTGYGFGKH